MIYSKDVEKMCTVAKGVNHGPAPIPEEGKWVKAKEIKDISGLTNSHRSRGREVPPHIGDLCVT